MAVADSAGLKIFGRPTASDAQAAFEALVRHHEQRVLGTALRLLEHREDAQDVAQEVFLRLHRHLGRLGDDVVVEPWLIRVTVNLCRDRWRTAQRRREVNLEETVDWRQPGPSPEARAIESERLRHVREALFRLGEKERLALLLRDVEGLPTGEVARLLGIKEPTVRVQIAKARLKLRELL